MAPSPSNSPSDLDAVIVGAGFSGLYALYKLRGLGLRPNHTEGYPRQEWILLDYAGLTVHVFTPRMRNSRSARSVRAIASLKLVPQMVTFTSSESK